MGCLYFKIFFRQIIFFYDNSKRKKYKRKTNIFTESCYTFVQEEILRKFVKQFIKIVKILKSRFLYIKSSLNQKLLQIEQNCAESFL
jgi:hypothetical protein